MKNKQSGHKATLAILALALGGAIYLNYSVANSPVETASAQPASTEASEGVSAAVFDPLSGEDEAAQTLSDKNYGEAQLVSVSKDAGAEFFEAARLSRSKSRDEALDTIKATLKNAKLEEDEKNELTKQLQAEVNNITAESGLETMIKAKGFADCVVALEGDKANVTVMTANDTLTAAEVAKIRDVLLSKCQGMKAENITVVEVK